MKWNLLAFALIAAMGGAVYWGGVEAGKEERARDDAIVKRITDVCRRD